MMVDSRINSLIAQLEKLDYLPYQIQGIIREIINGNNLDNITADQADQIVEQLEGYIIFAKKCKKKNNAKSIKNSPRL